MEVRIRWKCTDCENGVVSNSEWVAWNKGYDTWRSQFPTAAQTQPWPNDYERENSMPDSPQELPCAECEGETWIHRWIPFTEAMEQNAPPASQ